MSRALELAEGGRGRVSPNPLVGAVIVRENQGPKAAPGRETVEAAVIGEGFHAELGGLHAERAALEDARARGEDPAGATMYVTLEPCAHSGRQPPCADAIAEAGIARVVIGTDDPSAKTAGQGPTHLREAGVEVDFAVGPEAAAARLLIQPFRKHARTGKPLVTYKVASTIDGKAAVPGGGWFTSPESRELVHRRRAEADAVAVGIGTALADDPLLTARDVEVHRQPTRVVFDTHAKLPVGSKLVASIGEAPLIVVVSLEAPGDRVLALRDAGAEILEANELAGALIELGSREITDLLLEGGPGLARAFLDAGEVDDLDLFIAPVLGGEADLPGPLAGATSLGEVIHPLDVSHETCGPDLLIRARLREW
jgi:diaminohydroxyphosphoribosylaminopyrimidine deaminase/5-amino-6-(5-phosphoribosylamino)uracil reductase